MAPSTAADVISIQGVLATYVAALDEKDYDRLDRVFSADAELTYVLGDGQTVTGRYPEIKKWVIETLSSFPISQHLIGLPLIEVDGAKATARSMLFNPMLLRRGESDDLFFVGGTYYDDLLKTGDTWRIVKRLERGTWHQGMPTDWSAPELAVTQTA